MKAGVHSVPLEALTWRRALYDHSGVKTRIPARLGDVFGEPHSHMWTDLQQMKIGYSSRNDAFDPSSEHPFSSRNTRCFSDTDNQWFLDVLRREGARFNATVNTLLVSSKTPVDEQVRMFADVGLIIGPHGANLVM